MSLSVLLLFPHQLYRDHTTLRSADVVWLVEDPLFFSQYTFHSKKLILHRASMKNFASDLVRQGKSVRYVDARELTNSLQIADILCTEGVHAVQAIEPNDSWLKNRVQHGCDKR
ncbi:MAG: cryptochrome/photolyase family protein, partial [Pirellula staleyi]